MPSWLGDKLRLPKLISAELSPHYDGPILFSRHHESHAASAFFPSPFEEAAVLTMDGVGEWDCTTLGVGHGNQLELERVTTLSAFSWSSLQCFYILLRIQSKFRRI